MTRVLVYLKMVLDRLAVLHNVAVTVLKAKEPVVTLPMAIVIVAHHFNMNDFKRSYEPFRRL